MLDGRIRYGPGDERVLEIVKVPAWAVVAETIVDRACHLSGHAFCRCWEWTFHLGLGRGAVRTHDPEKWNLGNALYQLGQQLHSVAERRQTPVISIPVSREFIAEHFPATAAADLQDEAARA